jgi:hypothetical protein
MPEASRRSRRRLVALAIVAALVALAAMPTYLALSPSWRPTAVRVACAAAVIAGCVRALRWARGAAAPSVISAVDAPVPPPAGPELDARFLSLREDVISGTRSRRYFEVILWPRLCALAGTALPRPANRRGLPRRGPSLRAIEELVARIERRP